MKVTVVAWQYGQLFEPKVKAAESMIQCFWIERN